ncbi:uncharacterized protein LOC113335777 isoform X1 [Papaver somniferum]|uniref:uncharacterized protein LOC113335777 isoform X1 n=1 Tax=Papaver somniferum TaxID=3469 RepID=UPI000E6FA9D6|nr:uncharacterized protein LOC113335777 isoform X1 [Papaver somniferum]
MASGGENFYSVLGVKKECTVSELRNAYKKLAMRWHPDRCSASGNSKFIEESKKKFQSIQEAYSVLSNANKRFMYDLGLYKNDDDDDDDNEMGDFLGEMVDLMAQTKPIENSKAETFEDLQVLFEAMVQGNMQAFNSAPSFPASNSRNNSTNTSSKRNCADLNSYSGWEQMDFRPAESHGQSFCLGAEGGLEDSRGGRGSSKRRTAGKQKSSSQHNMSARDSKISV